MMQSHEALKARAEAASRIVTPEEKVSAVSEDKTAQEAVRLRMAQHRAAGLAREAAGITETKATGEAKAKLGGKRKR
jgi:hypothetical protein